MFSVWYRVRFVVVVCFMVNELFLLDREGELLFGGSEDVRESVERRKEEEGRSYEDIWGRERNCYFGDFYGLGFVCSFSFIFFVYLVFLG